MVRAGVKPGALALKRLLFRGPRAQAGTSPPVTAPRAFCSGAVSAEEQKGESWLLCHSWSSSGS